MNALCSQPDLKREIKLILIKLGFSPNLIGYKFLCTAIEFTVEDNTLINKVTKCLYPKVAEFYGERASCVERGIRNVINVAFTNKKIVEMNNLFSTRLFTLRDRPTTSQLIALITEKIFINHL